MLLSWITHWFENALEGGSKREHEFVWTVENASKWKWWPKILQGHVIVACTSSSTYITTYNSIIFKCFWVHSRKRIRSVVWTRFNWCVFHDKKNACYWKCICVDRALWESLEGYQFTCCFLGAPLQLVKKLITPFEKC